MNKFGKNSLNLNDIGTAMVDNVMSRVGINLNAKVQLKKTYFLNRNNHILIDLFKSKSQKSSKDEAKK